MALAPDPQAAVAFLELLRPGGPWVLTAITPDGPTTTETFTKAATVAKWIKRQNANRNIYWMPAEAAGTLRKKASKQDIARTFLLWADLDGIGDISHLNGQVPPPTAVVASGGGFHLYWALSEPIDDTAEIEARNRWIEKQLNADQCHNSDRILRVPGTVNWPGKTKKAKGRVPILARLAEHYPDRKVNLDDFGRVEDGRPKDRQPDDPSGSGILQATDLDAIADTIPNPDLGWPDWNQIAMEFYAASGGSGAGFAAFDRWSAKAAELYGGTEAKWEALEKCPPESITAGSLVRRAQLAKPGFRRPSLGPDPKVDTHWQDADPHATGRTRGSGPDQREPELVLTVAQVAELKREAFRAGREAGLSDALEREPDDDGLTVAYDDLPPGSGKFNPEPDPPNVPALATLSMADLVDVPVPILRYLAADWVPRAKAVLMAGMGGSGKTTLACQLAAARATGLPFLGLNVDPGVTLALLCEDDWDDAHRMLARLANSFGRGLGNFADFHYLAAAGDDNVLVAQLRNGRIVPTKFYQLWQERLGDLKATLQILDNCRHIAAINENDGVEVTTAWALLHAVGRPTGAATILLGHTPKSGNAEFSGNAAWENVARVRLFLGPVAAEIGEDPIENDPRRIFRRGKANANGTARMDLVWERGAFRLEHPELASYGDKLGRDMRQGQACQAFLDALGILTAQHRSTSHGEAARNYAPRVIKAAGLAGGFTAKDLTAAMNALFKDGRIKAEMPLPWRDKCRHVVVGIARC